MEGGRHRLRPGPRLQRVATAITLSGTFGSAAAGPCMDFDDAQTAASDVGEWHTAVEND